MGKLVSFALVLLVAVLTATSLRADVAADPPADTVTDQPVYVLLPPASPEPITGSAVMPAPSTTPPGRGPTDPYNPGPPDQVWTYDQLSPEEQAAVDRGRDIANRDQHHLGVAQAVRDQSMRARAEAAQHELGIEGLDGAGVTP